MNPSGGLGGAAVLVTGASGFIGTRAVAALEAVGAVVHALDRVPCAAVPPERGHVADIRDAESVAAAVAAARPAYVLHLAAAKERSALLGDFAPLMDANAVGTANLLAATAAVPGVRMMVAVGTAEEYGAQPCPFREDMCEAPASAYSLSKACASHACRTAHRLGGLPVVELRPTLAYGPGQPPDMFLPALVAALAAGRHFAMTAGEQTRDFVYVDDLVAALLAALLTPEAAGRVVNVGSGKPVALADLARSVARMLDAEELLGIGEVPYRTGEVMDYWVDPTLAAELLGWRATTPLTDGLRAVVDDACTRH